MYDIMMASAGTTTPLRYEVNYRNYFLVTQGTVRILLIPPKDTRYLYPINDYDVLEFRSPVNPWKVQSEYRDDFDKIKTLEVELFQGMVMFIPAYWWYSIQFIGSETSVCSFKYRTHMNTLAIAPQLTLNVLQNMNIKRDTLEKRASVKSPFSDGVDTTDGGGSGGSGGSEPHPTPPPPPTEYTPSVDSQYLPKSIRGTSNNPYSIMNAVTENVASANASAAAGTSMEDNVGSADLETSIAATAVVGTPSAEYISQTPAVSSDM
jgi:hypothetical protein